MVFRARRINDAPDSYITEIGSSEFGKIETPKFLRQAPFESLPLSYYSPAFSAFSQSGHLVLKLGGKEAVIESVNHSRELEALINDKLAELGAPLTPAAKFSAAVGTVFSSYKSRAEERVIPADLEASLNVISTCDDILATVPVSIGREDGLLRINPLSFPQAVHRPDAAPAPGIAA